MSKLVFVVFLLVKSVQCAFFDLTDVDDPLSLLWHTKDFGDGQGRRTCTVVRSDGTTISGFCKHKTECLLSGGRLYFDYRTCGILSTCCIQNSCSHQTNAKVSYFTSDNFNANLSDCTFTVEAQNDNICQMRLDFDTFELSPSEERAIGSNTDTANVPPNDQTQPYHRTCPTDYMTVFPKTYNIPIFCGNNDRQHVYVHLYSNRQVILNMHIENRQTTQNTQVISNPRWKIRVTQLECPGPRNFFTKHSTLFSNENDYRLLAPEGAIQYFPAISGQIRSFGFDGATGEYISGLNYSIAFRRRPNVNCIRFSTNYIMLRNKGGTPDSSYCGDYLFILRMQTTAPARYGSQICPMAGNTKAAPQIYQLTAPGPFYIYFSTQETYLHLGTSSDSAVHAFEIEYDLTSCN